MLQIVGVGFGESGHWGGRENKILYIVAQWEK